MMDDLSDVYDLVDGIRDMLRGWKGAEITLDAAEVRRVLDAFDRLDEIVENVKITADWWSEERTTQHLIELGKEAMIPAYKDHARQLRDIIKYAGTTPED